MRKLRRLLSAFKSTGFEGAFDKTSDSQLTNSRSSWPPRGGFTYQYQL